MPDTDPLRQKIDDLCEDIKYQREDFTELRKYVEQLAASQIRIESVFVSQQDLHNRLQDYTLQMSTLNIRITRLETYMVILGCAIVILATAIAPYIIQGLMS